MTTAVETRVLVAGGAATILVGSLIYWLVQVYPLSVELSRLRTQVVSEQQAKESAQRTFEQQKTKMGEAMAEIQRLHLFDLRDETDFNRVFASRSNVGLLAFTEIFQQNNVSVESLLPGNIENRPIIAQGSAQGGVLRKRYRIQGSGLYQNLVKAFEGIKSFPPAVDIERYSLKYQGTEGTQARVSFDMTIGINFLSTTQQLEAASASPPATSSVAFEPLDDFVPTAMASESSVNGVLPVPVPGAPQNLLQNLQQLAPPPQGAKVGWLDQWWSWLDPDAIAAPATASPTPAPYLFNTGKAATLGRAEPFLPLAGAVLRKVAPMAMPLGALPTVNLLPPAVVPEAPPPQAALIAVLLSNDRPANALLQYGGTRALIHQGSVLEGGDQVVAIGRDFVLIRHKKALRRVELRSIGSTQSEEEPKAPMTLPVGSPVPSATGAAVPTPLLPPVPQAPRLPN